MSQQVTVTLSQENVALILHVLQGGVIDESQESQVQDVSAALQQALTDAATSDDDEAECDGPGGEDAENTEDAQDVAEQNDADEAELSAEPNIIELGGH